MDKTIKVNLGGILFQLDEDAYKMLKDYLQAIDVRLKNTPGGIETLEDIESRIAEIFQSQKKNAGIITKENVSAMITIIGQPEDFDNTTIPSVMHSIINRLPGDYSVIFPIRSLEGSAGESDHI